MECALPEWIVKKRNKWEKKLLVKMKIKLCIDFLDLIDIYVFGDTSLLGTCTEANVVICQPSGIKHRLISSKSRF